MNMINPDTPKSEKKLSASQRSELMSDISNTLKHKMGGIMAVWAYMNGGRAPLERLFRQKGYHGEREKDFIPELAAKLARNPDFPKDNISLIDLGHGQAVEKTRDFIEAFNKAANDNLPEGIPPYNRFVEAVGVDIVPDYGPHYVEELSAYFDYKARGEEFKPEVRSITSEYTDIKEPIKTKGVPVMISWNTPLWNAPNHVGDMGPNEIRPKALKLAARLVGKDGYMVLNHYVSTKEDQDFYESDDNREAIAAILRLVEKELEPECYLDHDPVDSEEDTASREKIPFSKCFNYETKIDEEDSARRMDVVARDDITVKIGDLFYKTMSKGEKFCFVSAAKLTQAGFDRHVQQAGLFEKIYTADSRDGTIIGEAMQIVAHPQKRL